MDLLLACFLLSVGSLLYRLYFRKSVDLKLPPGPKPWPIIGNIMDLPPKGIPEHQHWLVHKDIYGPVSSVTILGQTMIILHDKDDVHELMEKNSLKTSSRPSLEFANNWCNFRKFTVCKPYGDVFRRHRKCMHQQLGTKKLIEQYNAVLEAEAGRFILRLLEDPQNLAQHLKTQAGATILKIMYGYTIEPRAIDPLVELIDRMMVHFSAAFVPLASPVDIIPAFKYLPEWFPGTSFKGKAKEVRQIMQTAADTPYIFVQQQMTTQTHSPSYVSRLAEIDNGQRSNFDAEDAIKWSAVNLFAGGADTTVSTLFSVVLAMLKFPEVNRKAQNEIDTLTGCDRLPCLKDRDNLPYMNRVVKEALRWFPIVPLGVAHTADEDIVLRNYLIPKGAVLLPAIRWFLHDPQVYADPELFDPDRYLPPRNEPDPATVAFGFGRRVCPGRYLADSNLFLTIAQMLATFDIRKARDNEGKEIEPHVTSESGLIDHPGAFPYRMIPRSQKHVSLIRSIEVDHPWEESSANALANLSLG